MDARPNRGVPSLTLAEVGVVMSVALYAPTALVVGAAALRNGGLRPAPLAMALA